MFERTIEIGESGVRVDAYLAATLPQYTRSRLAKAIQAGEVTVSGKSVRPSHRLGTGDVVICPDLADTAPPETLLPERLPLDILYEDDDLLVVDKPAGMSTHPGAGISSGTLVHALLGHGVQLSQTGEAFRPGIVHRLDKDTSGLLLIAKRDAIHAKLQRMIQSRQVDRHYLCIVRGNPKEDAFTISGWIGRHPKDRKKMAAFRPETPGARDARTDLRVVERFPGYALLEAKLHTGRTHQVRVHLASIGFPIFNDAVYGSKSAGDKSLPQSLVGQALRAYRLDFEHPVTGRPLSFRAATPREWEDVLSFLRGDATSQVPIPH